MSESKLVNAARVNNKTTHNGMTTNHTSLDACIPPDPSGRFLPL